MLSNSKGKIYYGMHFYPGVAEYREVGKDPYRVYLNEDTIRSMDPSFAGKPIFVDHVDEVDSNIDEVKKVADGWVSESFYNRADGKHWCKFIIVSERGERAIQSGMRLSNAYIPKTFDKGGQWNGVDYTREITGAEYEHLAIVQNPRYEESVILTPEEFKAYNEEKVVELKRLANSQENEGETKMKLSFFKRAKVENSVDLEGMSVVLPKSKKEMTIEQLVNDMDAIQNMDGYANGDHMVKIHDGSEMKVSELVDKHKAMNAELEEMKKPKEENAEESESDVDDEKDPVDSESAPAEKNAEDEAKEAKDKEDADKKKNAKAKAAALKNAHLKPQLEEAPRVVLSSDQIKRGKELY